MGGIIYPVAASWVWGGGFLEGLGMKDFAGSGVVHELGGLGGFVGTLILGPRLNVFQESNSINYQAVAERGLRSERGNQNYFKQKLAGDKNLDKRKISHKVDTDIIQRAFKKQNKNIAKLQN